MTLSKYWVISYSESVSSSPTTTILKEKKDSTSAVLFWSQRANSETSGCESMRSSSTEPEVQSTLKHLATSSYLLSSWAWRKVTWLDLHATKERGLWSRQLFTWPIGVRPTSFFIDRSLLFLRLYRIWTRFRVYPAGN